MIEVRLQRDPFDAGAELARLERLGGGGVASFTGIVRGEGGLAALELEHYPGMTEAHLRGLAEDAMARWPLLGVTLVHRVGPMSPGEGIVLAATASAHRHAALESCAFLIDRAKADVPFWKRERLADGAARWVEPRAGDDDAATRWRANGAGL